MWFVIGLALFRDRPLWQVVQQLDLSEWTSAACTECQRASPPAPGRGALAELFGLLTQAWSRPGGECAPATARAGFNGWVWSGRRRTP